MKPSPARAAADRPADAASLHADGRAAGARQAAAPARRHRVVPHAHPWGQVALSSTGVIRVTAPHGSYIVPPSRAVWIPPGVEHAVTVIEDAELLTLYLHQPRSRCGPARSAAESAGWRQCRVLEVSSLLLALALQLDTTPDARRTAPGARDARARAPPRRAPARRAAPRRAGPPRRRPAAGKAPAPPVRSGDRGAVAPRHARRLGRPTPARARAP